MGEYCAATCGMTLECSHPCTGKCGECFNGRLHLNCSSKCEKALVCGHICKSPCSTECPPCQDKCFWKCAHSKCEKKCGVPCINCKEKCLRRCLHRYCKAKCGDKCSGKPCALPCLKRLKCKHPCAGFCGEPCPPLCRICDRETLTEIFFGDEDEEDARFVVLVDCGHVFESRGLQNWMQMTVVDGRTEIGMKKCPRCSVPIYNTKKYQSIIMETYQKVSKVKGVYYASKSSNQSRSIIKVLQGLGNVWQTEAVSLLDEIGYTPEYRRRKRVRYISDQEMSLYSFQANFLKSAKAVKTKVGAKDARLQSLVRTVMSHSTSISDQRMQESSCELRRLAVSVGVEKVRNSSLRQRVEHVLTRINAIMTPTVKFTEELERSVVGLLKKAERVLGSLGIDDRERMAIVKAMGMTQGHWYECPNGHVYCITECGGAMVEGTCPDCKAKIGGSSHRLRADNRVATKMDGAIRSAWPGDACIFYSHVRTRRFISIISSERHFIP
ncbi:UNVERIFIED_CONTAM: hypothetical protein GTU68_058133 [Idotea baltica]|nr:hypothetical protein [Idotea baltica]